MALFEDFVWENIFYSTTVPGEFIELNAHDPGVDNKMAIFLKKNESTKRKYLPYLLVNLIGNKRGI